MTREYPVGECASCTTTKPLAARGLCRSCYQRWRKNGTTAYVREFKDRTCTVEGCDNRQHGQGLCSKHLLRLRRTGTVAEGRAYTHKVKDPKVLPSQHDLYPIWTSFSHRSRERMVVAEWGDFDRFVRDVKERPSKRHRLYAIDSKEPLGPTNFKWLQAIVDKDPNETYKEYQSRSRKARRDANGTYYTDSELRRKYGITLADYMERAKAQDYRCAICNEEEKELRAGIPKAMAIDHCHATGKVRQLLCHPCNKGLGHFRDRPTLLALASAYLIKHGTNPAD